nr:uncharacterized protein C227.17c-like [Ipomoea trifida]
MLVTKKSKPGDMVKNTRHTKKDSNVPTTSRGNQYSLLADIPDDYAPTTHRQHTDKNKSRPTPRQTSKGKNSAPTGNPPPAPPQPRPPQPPSTAPSSANPPTHSTRSRGGRPAAARGRGRGLGRGHSPSHDNHLSNVSFSGSESQSIPQGVFQFGGTHPSSSSMAAPVHQMQQYYRLGNLDNCSDKWSALYDCLTLKTKRQAEVEVTFEINPLPVLH